jgi:hypothetical protein
MRLSRTVLRNEGRGERDCRVLRSRILLLAAQRRRFGYRRIHALIRREGLAVNCKRVQRIYCEERLQVTRRKRRRGVAVERRALEVPRAPNEVWSIDFVSDSLEHGRRLAEQQQVGYGAAVGGHHLLTALKGLKLPGHRGPAGRLCEALGSQRSLPGVVVQQRSAQLGRARQQESLGLICCRWTLRDRFPPELLQPGAALCARSSEGRRMAGHE